MIKSHVFRKKIFKAISSWNDKKNQRKYREAKKIAGNIVECCKKIKNYPNISEIAQSEITLIAIFFKGLEELSDLLAIQDAENWMADTNNICIVWNLLQNSEERLNASMNLLGIKREILASINKSIDDVEQLFLNYFGPGQYVSPEILIKKTECSICHSDFRKCNHLQGVIYNGKLCKMMGGDIEIQSVSLVTEPRDRRCRIWQFNTEKKSDGTLLIKDLVTLTAFSIDDFL